MSSKKAQIIGWKYSLGMHMVPCHGPIDEIQAISFGDRQAWAGLRIGSGDIYVDAPKLFGGDQREGGVFGTVHVAMGEDSQIQNPYLVSQLGGDVPAFRGVVSMIFNKFNIGSNNPYVKKLAVRMKRIQQGWSTGAAWFPERAEISGAMNPAHILYECISNTDWGMGYPTTSIDDTNFREGADKFFFEGFGLCLMWDRQGKIQDFMEDVADHAGVVLRADPVTGKFQIKLLRDDYDVEFLATFDESNSTVTEFSRPNWGETTNEIVVKYTEMNQGTVKVLAVQDLANVSIQNSVVSTSREYVGIVSDTIAGLVAMRDLRAVSTPLAKMQLIANRKNASINIGDVVLINSEIYGIVGMPARVLKVSYGTLLDGAIKLDVVEDIYGLPQTAYIRPQPIQFIDPNRPPAPMVLQRAMETPYWEIQRVASVGDFAALDDDSSAFITAFGVRPADGIFSFNMAIQQSGVYVADDASEFCPTCLTTFAVGYADVEIPYSTGFELSDVALGDYAYLNDEVIVITAINTTTQILTVKRGMMDTVPTRHALGSRIYFSEDYTASSSTEYLLGDTLNVKLLTVSTIGILEQSLAPTIVKPLVGRFGKPYPPARVRINGLEYPERILNAPITITWVHRDRVQQITPVLVDQYAASIGPEAGTTYNIRVYNHDTNALLDSGTGLTGLTFSTALLPVETFNVRIELESVVETRVSWQKHVIILEIVEPVYFETEDGDSLILEGGVDEFILERD